MISAFSRPSSSKSTQTQLAGYALRKARSEGYTRLAKQQFLEGTSFSCPGEAISAGFKSIQEWCDCLERFRDEFRVGPGQSGN